MEQKPKSKKNKTTTAPDPDAGIMTLLRNQAQGTADQEIYSATSSMDRTIFVVDLSKLEAEGDTLVGALVLYYPEHELKKSRYEQRCSQLIGIALCMKNFTTKYPKYVHLKGSGFAVRSLGGVYVMGLSSRLEEPSSCVVSLAELIHSMFQFYYHSPDEVLQSCNGDWAKFTMAMSRIFGSIIDFLAKDKHSVPAMFRPLPYIDMTTCKKSRQELYLASSRVLRACQNLDPIIGGCIMYNAKLVLSQFPSSLTELLVILGSGVMDLKHHSILKDEVVPDKVWLLQVFLTTKQKKIALRQRDTISALQESYSSMSANPQLFNSTLQWRFQPSSANSSSTAGSGKQIKKLNWSRRTHKSRLMALSNTLTSSSSSSSREGKRNEAMNLSRVPFSTSTPQQQQQHNQRQHGSDSVSMQSMDAVLVSPGLDSVSFNNDHIKSKRKTEALRRKERKTSETFEDFPHGEGPDWIGNGSMTNDAEDLYLDAVDVNPAMALGPEMLRLFSNSSSTDDNKEKRKDSNVELRLNDDGPSTTQQLGKGLVHGTGSTSSEGFATPSPTPPHRSSVISMSGRQQRDNSTGPDIALSFKTASESFFCTTDEEADKEKGKDGSLMARPAATRGITSGMATVEELRDHDMSRKDDKRDSPDVGRKQYDSDDDFVDSEDLEKLLEMARLKSANAAVDENRLHLTDSLPPPPVPKRITSSAATGSKSSSAQHLPPTTLDTSREATDLPPVPPRRFVSSKEQRHDSEDDLKLSPSPVMHNSDLPPLPFEGIDGKPGEEDEEDDNENHAPPLPPRRKVSSPDLMLSGSLDPLRIQNHSETPAFLTAGDKSSGAATNGSTKSDLQASWIYGTINRDQGPKSLREYEDMENGAMENSVEEEEEEECKLSDDPKPKENFDAATEQISSPVGLQAASTSDNQVNAATTNGELLSSAGQDNAVGCDDCGNGEVHTIEQVDSNKDAAPTDFIDTDISTTELINSSKEEAGLDKEEAVSTEQERSSTVSQEDVSRTIPSKMHGIAREESDDISYEKQVKASDGDDEENHNGILENEKGGKDPGFHAKNVEKNGHQKPGVNGEENHFECEDNDGAEESPYTVPSKLPIVPRKNGNLPSHAVEEDHIYEFEEDDSYDQIDIDEVKRRNIGSADGSPSRLNRFEGRKYEEISDDVLFDRRTRGAVTESESSEASKVEVDDSESKTSSMTVTLDLSHIDKNDPLYSSVGDNRPSSHSGSIEISRVTTTADFNSNESSEEAGRDGMVTPVEITYSESMFNTVREKMVEGTDVEQAKTVSRPGDQDDDDDALSNDSAEYSSLPDEDESLLVKNHPRVSSEAQRRTKNWLSRTMERPTFLSQGGEVIERFSVYVQCYMDTYIVLLAEPDIHKNKYKEDVLHELWRPLAEQLLHLDSILEDKKERVESSKATNCIATYSSREKLCEAKPLSAAYHFRHAIRRAHQEYAKDPSLRQLSLSKEHCRMLSQNVHGREVYVQPSGCAGDAMCLHALIERNMKAKTSLKQQPTDAPKVMLI